MLHDKTTSNMVAQNPHEYHLELTFQQDGVQQQYLLGRWEMEYFLVDRLDNGDQKSDHRTHRI